MASAAMSRNRRNRRPPKIREPRITEDVKIARLILPHGQARAGIFIAVDISNHSDDDQRKMVRSGERRTIRRKPKIDELVDRKVINREEAAACEWYAQAHSLRYETTGITARYGESSGSGQTNFDHLPKTREQQEAFDHFEYARAGINPFVLALFERVVLYGRPLGKLKLTFRIAARQLLERIEGRVTL